MSVIETRETYTKVMDELRRLKKEWKERKKTFSLEEKKEYRAYRMDIEVRIQKAKEEKEIVWDTPIHVWDTRNPPSNIFEIEMAMEMRNRLWER